MSFKADLLKRKLKEERQTLEKFSKAVGVSTRTVNRWKSGENMPKPKDLEKIARVLNCKPQDFDPFFASTGLGDVSIQAHVSTSSHNAYEVMHWRYGVSQKEIMEIAPVLFSIVAAHALMVPDQDDELERIAQMSGRPGTQRIGDGIDRRASKLKKCFGIASPNPSDEPTRNLFDTAIHRLSGQAAEYVDDSLYIGAEPGSAPSASGYIPDTDVLKKITGEDQRLIEAIVKGRIRLSTILRDVKEGGDDNSVEAFAAAIQHAHGRSIEDQRKTGLKKLKAWREYYAERHPELADEYDVLVAKHCHEEGWYPEHYTDDDRNQSWVTPFQEDRHINDDTLPEYQRSKAEGNFAFAAQDPTYLRFFKLKQLRAELKKQFEQAWS